MENNDAPFKSKVVDRDLANVRRNGNRGDWLEESNDVRIVVVKWLTASQVEVQVAVLENGSWR